eukprot:GHVT01053365.1.p2 GENE.GHVT01053365.1~~GHVT01053365.1.p2  ORF type:complete len:251 (-),score=40.10 GHVT01053365.1:2473-3225(-)
MHEGHRRTMEIQPTEQGKDEDKQDKQDDEGEQDEEDKAKEEVQVFVFPVECSAISVCFRFESVGCSTASVQSAVNSSSQKIGELNEEFGRSKVAHRHEWFALELLANRLESGAWVECVSESSARAFDSPAAAAPLGHAVAAGSRPLLGSVAIGWGGWRWIVAKRNSTHEPSSSGVNVCEQHTAAAPARRASPRENNAPLGLPDGNLPTLNSDCGKTDITVKAQGTDAQISKTKDKMSSKLNTETIQPAGV